MAGSTLGVLGFRVRGVLVVGPACGGAAGGHTGGIDTRAGGVSRAVRSAVRPTSIRPTARLPPQRAWHSTFDAAGRGCPQPRALHLPRREEVAESRLDDRDVGRARRGQPPPPGGHAGRSPCQSARCPGAREVRRYVSRKRPGATELHTHRPGSIPGRRRHGRAFSGAVLVVHWLFRARRGTGCRPRTCRPRRLLASCARVPSCASPLRLGLGVGPSRRSGAP